MVLNEAQEAKGIVGFVVPTCIPSSVNVLGCSKGLKPFQLLNWKTWKKIMTQNVCCGYDEHWDYMRFFLSVLLLFPNRDELLEFFLKVSSKKENKTKEGKHACELGLIRTDFRHWAGQSTHIMLPASVLISAVRRQFSAQGFFNNKNTPCLSPDNTAAGITGPFFSHTHPDTKEKEYRDSLLSDNTYQKFWRSQFSQ